MTKPWEETWTMEADDVGPGIRVSDDVMVDWLGPRARLAAAAPVLARALAWIEWSLATKPQDKECPCCCVRQFDDSQPGLRSHQSWCLLDLALNDAGLRTQQDRDAVRETLRKEVAAR